MSLMRTLARVAIGVAVAKGASALMKGAGRRASRDSGGGDTYGGAHSPDRASAPSGGGMGGLQDMLGQVLGGRAPTGGQSTGTRDIGDSGGLGGLIDGLSDGSDLPQGNDGFGTKLNDIFATGAEPQTPPSRQEEDAARIMLRAMLQAAKSDGEIDADEQSRILDNLRETVEAEKAFVNEVLSAPVDAESLARDTPAGLEQSVYLMSVMAIDLDNRTEAQYLHELAQAMKLSPQTVNDIHKQLGVPPLYS